MKPRHTRRSACVPVRVVPTCLIPDMDVADCCSVPCALRSASPRGSVSATLPRPVLDRPRPACNAWPSNATCAAGTVPSRSFPPGRPSAWGGPHRSSRCSRCRRDHRHGVVLRVLCLLRRFVPDGHHSRRALATCARICDGGAAICDLPLAVVAKDRAE